MRLAVTGGLNPWGRVVLRDMLYAIEAKRAEADKVNFQLVALIGNAMSANPRPMDTFSRGADRGK